MTRGDDAADGSFDPLHGPDPFAQIDASEILRELTEPDSWWRRRSSAAASPSYRIVRRYITGVLNLRGAELDMLLNFDQCLFEHRPDVRESQLRGLAFYRCVLPGLRARNLRCRNDLRLVRSTIQSGVSEGDREQSTGVLMGGSAEPGVPDAAVVLTDAVVEGSVVLTGSIFDHQDRKAVQGDRLSVVGALTAYRLETASEVRLAGLRTGGNVTFSGSRLRNRRGIALNVTGAHVGGSMLCESDVGRPSRDETDRPFAAEGMVFVPGTKIDGDLRLSGASVQVEPGGEIQVAAWRQGQRAGDPSIDPWPSVFGDRLRVEGNVLADGLRANGTVRLLNAAIGGSLRLSDATIEVERRELEPHYDRALHLDGSQIDGDVQATRLRAEGQLRLADVRIGGNLLARFASMHHPGRDVFSARRATVAGNVEIVNAKLTGTLQLQGVRVGGSIELTGASLTHPAVQDHRGYSVGLRAATVGRDLVMAPYLGEPLRADGGVNLDGLHVARRLTLDGALLGSPDTRVALDAGDTVAGEFLLTPGARPQGRVILRGAHCGTLADNPALWQATRGLELEDFRYDALSRPIALDDDPQVKHRVELLRSAMNGYRPGPYDQLATMLRASGNEEHAATVLMRKQQFRYDALARGSNPVVGAGVRLWSVLQRAVVGYGYRPTRALLWLVLLLVAGSLWFWLMPDACVNDPRYTVRGPRCLVNADDTGLEWNPVLHTADLLVPIVDLGNKGRWHMGGADKWVATAFIAAGWILVTTVAAGVARALRRS